MKENICKWSNQQGINLQNLKQLKQLNIKKKKINKRTEDLTKYLPKTYKWLTGTGKDVQHHY